MNPIFNASRYFLWLLLCLCISSNSYGQLSSNRAKITAAGENLTSAFQAFNNCFENCDLDESIGTLKKAAIDEYRSYLIGGVLYLIDSISSFELHQKAWQANKNDKNFTLEYAIELHRRRSYAEAQKLYERIVQEDSGDYHIHVWLADCYINTGDIPKAIHEWGKAGHAHNHTGIDMAINDIYGRADQMRLRNNYRKDLAQGKSTTLSKLIFLDMNWQMDPWNTKEQTILLNADLALAEKKLDNLNADLKMMKAYIDIKKMKAEFMSPDSIKQAIIKAGYIFDKKPFPKGGNLTSELIQICLSYNLLTEKELYNERGEEILSLAKKRKDIDLLNIYAYLQAQVLGHVDPAIDKMGWIEFKDERFAISYFTGKGEKNRYDDPELSQAIADFPNSSSLYKVKTLCATLEHKPAKELLVELIKKEFRTLGSDPSHYSYPLNAFFGYLASEK